MKRGAFIKSLGGLVAMSTLDLQTFGTEVLSEKSTPTMPVLFIGHGSPMNAIEHNAFTERLNKLGKELLPPKAILVVSAHWQTRGTFVHISPAPKTIHDFGGFPKALFEVQYPAPGAPEIAKQVSAEVKGTEILHDTDWGLDHGAWAVLNQIYPEANIPVFQMSLDFSQGTEYHYKLAKQLQRFRTKGVLILGSGNIVHNLRVLDWNHPNNSAFDWALEFDSSVKKFLDTRQHSSLIAYEKMGKSALLSVPTNEHYLPMLYAAALQLPNDQLNYVYEEMQMGSISMRSFMIG